MFVGSLTSLDKLGLLATARLEKRVGGLLSAKNSANLVDEGSGSKCTAPTDDSSAQFYCTSDLGLWYDHCPGKSRIAIHSINIFTF